MSREYCDFIKFIKNNKLGIIEEDADLKKYCTLKIGGKCYSLYKPDSISNLIKAYKFILRKKIDYFIIGNGSNLLISDDYHFKVFICLKGLNKVVLNEDTIYVESGVMGNVLAKKVSYNFLSGIEFLAGIPGTIGGIIYMNAGAWNKSISEVLERITYLDEFGKVCVMDEINDKGFSYRKSPFMKRNVIILSCELRLRKDISSVNRYIEYLDKKKSTQPLKEHSAGCTFKNPKNYFAWKLIKEVECEKIVNDAVVSDVHANFLINQNNATFDDMYKLISNIQNSVFNKFNINLEIEWNIIE